MPVTTEAELALSRYIEVMAADPNIQDQLNTIDDLVRLRAAVRSIEPSLTGSALIPLEQATRSPKILVGSDITVQGIPWRLLRCTGGPLVLQLICKKANFAIWIESC
ncbi:hypothetical protein N8506_02105 [Synechococcus sp. AH-601-N23]|nr:hypothetical protein [Synechococcus sp. AH-601-N23]